MRWPLVLIPSVLTAFVAIGAAPAPLRYALDPAQSQVAAKVAFLGLASKSAHFPIVGGGISLSPARLDRIDLDVTLDARALTASDKTTTERLRGPKFFDVANHPTVRFTGRKLAMTGATSAQVDGTITARGVTRPARLAVIFAQRPDQATGREPIGLTATGTIDRRDFGMTSYGLIVGKKVTITIKARLVPG